MKKNYLLVALMSALVLSGCGNSTSSSSASNSSTTISSSISSSSSSSSSVADALPTVADAVEKLTFDYTVEYTNAMNESYSVFVEDTDYNEVILFFESTNDGYYFDTTDNAYYFYMNGLNEPTYNTVGKLASEDAKALKSLIDVKSAFEDASWELVSEGKEIVYYTEDAEVLAVTAFLSESYDVIPTSVEVSIKTSSSSTKLVSYTTFDESGNALVTADFKRMGTTYATDSMPLLNDDIDAGLEGLWYIAYTDTASVIGATDAFFEIFVEDEASFLVEYEVTEQYELVAADVFEYVSPSGYGSYVFKNASEDLVEIACANGGLVDETGYRIYNSGCIFATRDHSTNAIANGIAISYYEISFISAVYAYNDYAKTNPEITTQLQIEVFQPTDPDYASYVTELDAIGAYQISQFDANGNLVEAAVYTQWATIDSLIDTLDGLMQGGFSSTFYNGCALGFYLYATYFMTGYITEEAVYILYDISMFLTPFYAPVDVTKYSTPEEGQSTKDYIVAEMGRMGYTANSESFVIEGTDYLALIKEVNTSEESGITCTDVIFFTKADGSYGCILVIDDNGTEFVTTIGFGYFETIGIIYELLVSWNYAQQNPAA